MVEESNICETTRCWRWTTRKVWKIPTQCRRRARKVAEVRTIAGSGVVISNLSACLIGDACPNEGNLMDGAKTGEKNIMRSHAAKTKGAVEEGRMRCEEKEVS